MNLHNKRDIEDADDAEMFQLATNIWEIFKNGNTSPPMALATLVLVISNFIDYAKEESKQCVLDETIEALKNCVKIRGE